MKDTVVSRKDRIMRVALSLFATKGYMDTSTKEISIEAGVSEALIFKHFGNKETLLSNIIKSGYRRILSHHRGMMTYGGPKDFLRNMIFLPSKLVAEEPLFWQLQERLSHNTFSRQQHELFMKPVQPIIVRAFRELGYEDPELETHFLLLLIDMLWKREASGDIVNGVQLAKLLEEKYNLL
ncbi:TetR/AcrR family transcriptional regulator [Sphingobacterium sp. UT-1RO-CII-1]|uniref:TetR/AcrR family transcriptional regulator n=1 Tax=Sphingobacterium sp. UT-1RO-CII-1 TaxID=2995225 RepID=UPI00227A9B1C|nr:TetR/AcrR family transcriptional regulator [Sphingobacterium sp. UT-1RO-CII-1]MCY4780898.1 TetR/AcrR family transcriptional regulator [Sphingobacterium sp. UT-1RO-CII-1]